VLPDEETVFRRVVDDKVHHQPDAPLPRFPAKTLDVEEFVLLGRPGGGQKKGIELPVVLHRVEAARKPRIVERIQVNPIEPEGGRVIEDLRPPVHGPHEPGEKVVNPGCRVHTLSVVDIIGARV